MKAVYYEQYGGPEVLNIKEMNKPEITDDELLIKVYSSTVTSGDVHLRKADPFLVRFFNGLLKPKKIRVLGNEFSGVIESIGTNVKNFSLYDKVFGAAGFNSGTNAEYIKLNKDSVLTEIPQNINFKQASAVPFGALASFSFLKKKANISEGNQLLIYGASGALGVYAIQIAKYFGAVVTAVCSTQNVGLVKSLGADFVIDYKKDDFTDNNNKYEVIFDTVGKSPFWGSIKKLKKGGIFLRSVHTDLSDILRGLIVNLFYGKKVIGGIAIEEKEDLDFIKELIENRKLIPVIDREYHLNEIRDAHTYVEQGHKKGAVVVNFI